MASNYVLFTIGAIDIHFKRVVSGLRTYVVQKQTYLVIHETSECFIFFDKIRHLTFYFCLVHILLNFNDVAELVYC